MNRLGYTGYVAQGGDIGAAVTDAMAIQAPDGLGGIHLNFLRRPPPGVTAALLGRAPVPQGLTDSERAAFAALGAQARKGYIAEQGTAAAAGQPPPEVTLPVAFTVFPGEIFQAPRSWAEQVYPNLIYFHEADRGGHFAAWEEPQLFATEVRAAFKPVR